MEITRIISNPTNQIYGILGNINISSNNENCHIISEYRFPKTVADYLSSTKSAKSLKMVFLNESYLDKTSSELSDVEIKKIILAKALIENKRMIALDYFEKGLNNKEKANFKRLFKKLTQDYNKTIIIFTNDLTFLWDICESITYVDNKEVINTYSKNNFFNISNINQPEIIKIINLIKEKNIQIDNYKSVLDLLKAIYRIKESQK